jgi:tetratricopeptide (TPR) repeat protein
MTPRRRPGLRARALLAALLFLTSVAALWPATGNEFVNYDDGKMVAENPAARSGFTRASLRWAFTSIEEGNWFPLTRLSHLGDVALYGLAPRGHHATSVLLHGANAALLFLLLEAFTGAAWPAALAAALFALHPLRVEAVAWVAERKEVLSFLCGMLALAAYLRHARRPGPWRLAVVALLLALGLTAKPVLVTLPFAMLLLDLWPLGRLGGGRADWRRLGLLAAEKVPLLAIAAAGSAVAYEAQRRGGATTMLELPAAARLANAAVAYARYLGATLWPARLSFFYPHPGSWPGWAVAGSCALVAALTALALLAWRRQPWLATGWLWFLGALVPMLGIVQIGWQSIADRYTYLPSVGLAVAVAWSAAALARRRPRLLPALAAAAALVLVPLAAQARRQTAVWRDSRTLYQRALDVDADNWLAHQNLGAMLVNERNPAGALPHLSVAARFRPDVADIWYNIGCARLSLRNYPDAIAALRHAIELDAMNADYYGNLGVAYFSVGRLDEAAAEYRRALQLNPGLDSIRQNLAFTEGMIRVIRGR